jgi:hypothetical protein
MQYNIELWKYVRQPFYIPEKIHHCTLADWESIDCDCAGCLICGKIHMCNDTLNCPVVSEEGRHVCVITGFYTRRQVFTDDEFVDTIGNLSCAEPPQLKRVDYDLVDLCVKEFLCSPRTRNSLYQETVKRQQRIKNIFIKLTKKNKVNKSAVNIMHLFTQTLNEISNVRNPEILSPEDALALADMCIDKINFFCNIFFENLKTVPAILKTKGFIIGFLYFMRTGLILCGNVEIVPMIKILTNVLPSENHVKLLFKISTKIMTEVENFIKQSVKKMCREKLLQIGFKTL